MPENLLFLRCLEELRCFVPAEPARQLLLQALHDVGANSEDATQQQLLSAVELTLPRALTEVYGDVRAEAIVAATRRVVEELKSEAAVPEPIENDRSTPVARLPLKRRQPVVRN